MSIQSEMLLEWLVCAVICTALSKSFLGYAGALLLGCLRATIPLMYFLAFPNGNWGPHPDDFVYQAGVTQLLKEGWTPFNVFSEQGLAALYLAGDGQHWGYYYWGLIPSSLFGSHYWTSVFPNVCASVAAAACLGPAFIAAGMPRRVSVVCQCWLALHYEAISWFSFCNIKDAVVMALTASLAGMFMLRVRHWFLNATTVIITSVCLATFRFYSPIIFYISLIIDRSLRRGAATKTVAIMATISIMPSVFDWGLSFLDEPDQFSVNSGPSVLLGMARFALIPEPWHLPEPQYAFTFCSNWLHWILFPVVLVGARVIWVKWPALRLMVVYLIATSVFYGIAAELGGFRQRLMALWAIAPMQAIGTMHLLGMPLQCMRRRLSKEKLKLYFAACRVKL